MDKIVISPNEITEIKETPDQPARIERKLPPAIPWWAGCQWGVLVLFLPCWPGDDYFAVAFAADPADPPMPGTSFFDTVGSSADF